VVAEADDDVDATDKGGAGSTASPYGVAGVVPSHGAGTIKVLTVPAAPISTEGRTVHYTIETEDGLPVDAAAFVRVVQAVLSDPRGWQEKDGVRFVPVTPSASADGADVDLRVTVASPTLTARLCAPARVSVQQVSCWNDGRAVLNLSRWVRGAHTYGADLAGYRTYLVNHEVGHGLGHGHVRCPAPGRPAPVMTQQTKGLDGCTAWPFPAGS